MKNLILLIVFGCIILTSCSKEELIEPAVEQKTEAAYLFKLTNTNNWEAEVVTNLKNKPNTNNERRSNSLHAHGKFSAFNGGLISFSGTQNNGGAHGGGKLKVTFGPFGTANVILKTVNVISIGDNEIIYGGQITEVIENTVMFPPPPSGIVVPECNSYELGTYVYFAVKDNGQGNNAPSDQYSPLLINNCNEIPNIDTALPWSIFGFNNVEGAKDKIKVND